MVEARDGEHSQPVERRGHRKSDPAEAYPDDGQTNGMHGEEGEDACPVHPGAVAPSERPAGARGEVAIVEPTGQFSPNPRDRGLTQVFIRWSHGGDPAVR